MDGSGVARSGHYRQFRDRIHVARRAGLGGRDHPLGIRHSIPVRDVYLAQAQSQPLRPSSPDLLERIGGRRFAQKDRDGARRALIFSSRNLLVNSALPEAMQVRTRSNPHASHIFTRVAMGSFPVPPTLTARSNATYVVMSGIVLWRPREHDGLEAANGQGI